MWSPYLKRLILIQSVITIDAELYDKDDLCDRIQIISGFLDSSNPPHKKELKKRLFAPSDVCSRAESCIIEVDLHKTCIDNSSTITTPKYTYNTTTAKTSVSTSIPKICKKDIITDKTKYSGANTDENTGASQTLALICGVVSVVAAGAIILCVCVWVRRYRNETTTEQTIELNTYTTSNCVLYADLDIAQTEHQTPAHVEESPYAEIIGVLETNKKGNT